MFILRGNQVVCYREYSQSAGCFYLPVKYLLELLLFVQNNNIVIIVKNEN